MKQKISGKFIAMAAGEILKHVSAATLLNIQKQDPHPTFKAFTIAHEGESSGRFIDRNVQGKQNWFRDAITKLHNRIDEGLKIFHLHNEDSSHDNRIAIGEVVGKGLQEINNKLHNFVVTYITPEFKDLPLDVASIEADVVYSKTSEGINIDDIANISGIALGNSANNIPGFPGATLLGCIQAFAKENSEKGDKSMTLEEIRAAIAGGKYRPSDVFSESELKNDALVANAIKAEYEHRQRTDKAFDEYKKTAEKQISDLKSANVLGTVDKMFAAIATRRNLDDKQKVFIEKQLPKFAVKEPEKVEIELDSFVDNGLKEYAEITKLITGKEPDPVANNKNAPAGDSKSGNTNDESDYTNPEKNDFIPK